jgi:hypothetical protein
MRYWRTKGYTQMANCRKKDLERKSIIYTMEVNKGHILCGWCILDEYMKGFKTAFERDMRANNMDDIQIKKILMNVDLLKVPRKDWTTKDDLILANIISYVLYQVAHRLDDLDECFKELDKRGKKEVLEKTMSSESYFLYRRTQFELKKLAQFCWDKNAEFEIIYENESFRIEKHIVNINGEHHQEGE